MSYAQTIKTIDVALTVATAAYTAGDVVGGLIALDLHSAGGGGQLRRVTLTDAASQAEPYTLYIFDQVPSTIADADPFAPTIADLKKLIATLSIVAGDYVTVNSLDYVIKDGLGIDFSAGNGSLWAYLVAVSTPDYAAATDLALRFTAWVD